MKLKATKKEIKKFFGDDVFAVGYCGAVELLRGCDAFAYSAGVYGWSCDYYKLGGVVICTGYNTIGKDINKITNIYEEKARKVSENYSLKWQDKDKKIKKIREKWLEALRSLEA